jgi:hypothetical protein
VTVRYMLHAGRALLADPTIKLAGAGLALSYGLQTLVGMVTEMRDELTTINRGLTDARRRLEELDGQVPYERPPAPGVRYPAKEDLDPLSAGGGQQDSETTDWRGKDYGDAYVGNFGGEDG